MSKRQTDGVNVNDDEACVRSFALGVFKFFDGDAPETIDEGRVVRWIERRDDVHNGGSIGERDGLVCTVNCDGEQYDTGGKVTRQKEPGWVIG